MLVRVAGENSLCGFGKNRANELYGRGDRTREFRHPRHLCDEDAGICHSLCVCALEAVPLTQVVRNWIRNVVNDGVVHHVHDRVVDALSEVHLGCEVRAHLGHNGELQTEARARHARAGVPTK